MKRKKIKEGHSLYEVPRVEVIDIVVEQAFATSGVTGTGDDYEVATTSFYDPLTNFFKNQNL